MRRYLFVIFAGLGVVVLTGASPIADLLSRVETLEGSVVALQSENQELTQQVSTLKAVSEGQPVLMDVSGVEVGSFLSATVTPRAESQTVEVALKFGDFRFILQIRDQEFPADGSLQFTSNDCSGEPYAWPGALGEATGSTISVPRIVSDSVIYVRAGDEREVFYGSSLRSNGECVNCAVTPRS